MSAEQGDVEVIREALETIDQDAYPETPYAFSALDRLAAALERAEREKEVLRLREALQAVMEIGLGYREGSLESVRALALAALRSEDTSDES